jgi:hypothetical protein
MNPREPRRLQPASNVALRAVAICVVLLHSALPSNAAGSPRFDLALGAGPTELSGESANAYFHGRNGGAGVAIRTGLGWLEPRIVLRDETFRLDGSRLSQDTDEVQIVSGSHRMLSGVAEAELHRMAARTVRAYLTLGLGVARVRDEFVSNDGSRLTGRGTHAEMTSALGLRLRPERMGAFAEGRWSRILSRSGDFSEYIRTSFGFTLGFAIRA